MPISAMGLGIVLGVSKFQINKVKQMECKTDFVVSFSKVEVNRSNFAR